MEPGKIFYVVPFLQIKSCHFDFYYLLLYPNNTVMYVISSVLEAELFFSYLTHFITNTSFMNYAHIYTISFVACEWNTAFGWF